MGGKAGRVLLSWVADNMAASIAISLTLALGAYCWGNINIVPLLELKQTTLATEYHDYVKDHAAFADRHLSAIYHLTDSIDGRLKVLETNDAVKRETLRHIEAALQEIHEAVIPPKRKGMD